MVKLTSILEGHPHRHLLLPIDLLVCIFKGFALVKLPCTGVLQGFFFGGCELAKDSIRNRNSAQQMTGSPI